ncbi:MULTISPECIES: hypothetical protein [unclassified Nocardioides]|uniref:hypothetical protein n=1 Tax=unclassified Nocardioides TaxID=2615069 RepID=UPI0030142E30
MTLVSPEARRDSTTWVTSAPHLQPAGPGGRMPWGTRHARVNTEPWTACGLPAATWKVFWHLPFETTGAQACRGCVDEVLRVRVEGRARG